MPEPPVVIRSWPQQSTEGGGTVTAGIKAEERPLNRLGYVVFIGKLGKQKEIVEVLANEAAPTPSGGYAKWARIPRPQRKSLTILEGYEPMTLTVPVLFDAVRENGQQENVEYQIQKLEWMAGRGNFYPHQRDGIGKPPAVEVYSASAEREVELIPKPFQSPNIEWFIDDITWDDHPIRGPLAARRRQAAVVKLVEYVVDPIEAGGGSKPAYTVKEITKGLNTVKKLVKHWLLGRPSRLGEAVAATLEENEFNRRVGSNPDKPLRAGTKIRIPNKYLE